MIEDELVLVDFSDYPIGTMGKMEVHRKGLLHRAFSIFIFNSSKQLLLQQRAYSKYHSGGLWTNTCCSHPRNGEITQEAANRRLKEEMGIECTLTPAFIFAYKVIFPNGLTEHELDHVFIGYSDAKPVINKEEAEDSKYMSIEEIKLDIKHHPEHYTEWFKLAFDQVANIVQSQRQ